MSVGFPDLRKVMDAESKRGKNRRQWLAALVAALGASLALTPGVPATTTASTSIVRPIHKIDEHNAKLLSTSPLAPADQKTGGILRISADEVSCNWKCDKQPSDCYTHCPNCPILS